MTGAEQIRSQLSPLGGLKTIIVGIGNTLKGDDAAGPLLCGFLAGRTCAEIIDAGTVPENYIYTIARKAPELLLVVDAIDFGAEAGAVRLLAPDQLELCIISTHTLSPRVFADMIRAETEVEVYFIGIQPARLGLGQSVSDEVSDSLKNLADILADILPAA
jgi:hydrogenase 3 maturation protease